MPAIQIAHSIIAGHQPILQLPGQMGINEVDGILYVRDASGNILPMYVGLPGALVGCNTSNNSGASTTSHDIAPGIAAADTAPYVQMVLSSTLTKNMTLSWAVGSGNGGLDTGLIGNGTYHLYLIRRPDTGVVDALYSLSPTSPTMPSGAYTQKRRIASVGRSGGNNVQYSQLGDEFLLKTPVLDVNDVEINNATHTYTLSVPAGIRAVAMGGLTAYNNDAAYGGMAAWSPDQNNFTAGQMWVGIEPGTDDASLFLVRTNTSAQIVIGTSKDFFVTWTTIGWYDFRGRT
jgi:hypothetical protein